MAASSCSKTAAVAMVAMVAMVVMVVATAATAVRMMARMMITTKMTVRPPLAGGFVGRDCGDCGENSPPRI
jgi:hypothetical protein